MTATNPGPKSESQVPIKQLLLYRGRETVPRSLRDLSSPAGIKHTPSALEAQSLNHWTTREVPEQTVAASNFFFSPTDMLCFEFRKIFNLHSYKHDE